MPVLRRLFAHAEKLQTDQRKPGTGRQGREESRETHDDQDHAEGFAEDGEHARCSSIDVYVSRTLPALAPALGPL